MLITLDNKKQILLFVRKYFGCGPNNVNELHSPVKNRHFRQMKYSLQIFNKTINAQVSDIEYNEKINSFKHIKNEITLLSSYIDLIALFVSGNPYKENSLIFDEIDTRLMSKLIFNSISPESFPKNYRSYRKKFRIILEEVLEDWLEDIQYVSYVTIHKLSQNIK